MIISAPAAASEQRTATAIDAFKMGARFPSRNYPVTVMKLFNRQQSARSIAIATLLSAVLFTANASLHAESAVAPARSQPALNCELRTGACAPWKYAGQTTYAFSNSGDRTHAHDVFRLWADENRAYVGVNLRWDLTRLMSTPTSAPVGNPLFECDARKAKCQLVKMDNEQRVSRIVGSHGDEMVAEVETYDADSLNSFDPAYARSTDRGRTWSPIVLPTACSKKATCRFAFPAPHRYVLLVTDITDNAFDTWRTRIFLSNDDAHTWSPLTQGKDIAAFGWNAAVTASAVSLVQGRDDAPKSIVAIDDLGKATTLLRHADQLHGRVNRLVAQDDTLYALLDSGAYPATGARLYAIRDGAAAPVWTSNDNAAQVWATPDLLVVETWNRQQFIASLGEFRTTLHVSTDHGAQWQSYLMPDDLVNSEVTVAGHRIWAVSGKGIAYFDVD